MSTAAHIGSQLLFPLGRALLAATFVISAVRHLTHWSAALDEMAGDATRATFPSNGLSPEFT